MAELKFEYPHKWTSLIPVFSSDPIKFEQLIQENDRALEDYLSALSFTATATAQIARTIYNPGSSTFVGAEATTTGKVVDSTNLVITFTAPASGNVDVHLQALSTGVFGDTVTTWVLLQSTTEGDQVPGGYINWLSSASGATLSHLVIPVTGLTPEASYTWYWAHYMNYIDFSPGGGTLYGGDYGPAIMTVYAAT